MPRDSTIRAAFISWATLILAVGLASGCATAPRPTVPSATTELLTERNKVAETLRMGEALDRIAQQAWEEKRLSTTRYQELHGQYAVMQQYGTRYAQQATVDLMGRREQSDRQDRQVVAQALIETFQSMFEQAQAWGLVQDVNELQP
jgi:osmotically-inducible protein OsmY